MADITITAANVVPASTARQKTGTSGATIVAGKVVALDPVTGKYVLADSNSATAALRSPAGIALNAAADGQPLSIATGGNVVMGATLVPGVALYLSDTPGGICPVADVGTGEYATVLGLAISASTFQIGIQESGVAL